MDLAQTLRRAIEERSQALAERLAELRGEVADDRLAIAAVLDLFAFLPAALEQVVALEWSRNPSSDSRVQLLRPLLRHLNEASTVVDEWLSRPGSPSFPLYVQDALEQACHPLRLGTQRVMMAEGPANNFTTMLGSEVRAALFGPLGPLCPPVPTRLMAPVVLIRAPRLEGSRVRWHPVLLGHEIGHIAAKVHDALSALNLAASFDMARAATIAPPGGETPGLAASLRLFDICQNWAIELICDALAVHAFGPSGVAALGDFLEVIGATDHVSDTHPPGRLRVHLLIRWLGDVADGRQDAIVEPWRALAAEPIVYSDQSLQFLCETLLARADDIAGIVAEWQDKYEFDDRAEIVQCAVEELAVGMPPECTALTSSGRQEVTPPDIIAAAWIGWVEGLEMPTDRLAEKSLADMEFLRRWSDAGGAWHVPQAPTTPTAGPAGTLSAVELADRLVASGDDRLVVTPLLPKYASGASLDLRLGNRFIVFERSRIASFNALESERDPRQMQQSIQLGWGATFVLHPGELVLAATLEYLVLPPDLTAQVLSRSSYGRLGLLSATAVQVHPHFHGCLTLELVNLGTVPLVLTPGERIAQLVVSRTMAVPPDPSSKYQCPIGPEFSKVRTDHEAEVLRGFSKRRTV